jgi:hypothetical protein
MPNRPAATEQHQAVVETVADLLEDSPALHRALLLRDFGRVVYVLTAVEQYSDKEIALQLGPIV